MTAEELAKIEAWSQGKTGIGEWPVDKLIERIRELGRRISSVHDARLEWAMVCQCTCAECDKFYEVVRDTLHEG